MVKAATPTPKQYGIDKDGREFPDPTPMAPQVGYKKQPTQADRLREMIRSERLAQEMAAAGLETFDEADDFDVPDDRPDPNTPYEEIFEGSVLGDVHKRLSKKIEDKKKATPSPASAEVGDKTFSGGGLQKLVDFIKTAPQEAIDKLIKPDK